MSRLIDADALKESLKESADRCREWITDCMDVKDYVMQGRAEQALFTFNECIMRTKSMPTIEERKTGRWIERQVTDEKCIEEWQSAMCSVCNRYHTTPYMYFFDNYKFCPNCGAKMEVENRC